MTKKHIDIKVIGNEEDLTSFAIIAAFINECRARGACRTLKVVVDGDGSASLSVQSKDEDGKWKPFWFSEDIKQGEAILDAWSKSELWIGE